MPFLEPGLRRNSCEIVGKRDERDLKAVLATNGLPLSQMIVEYPAKAGFSAAMLCIEKQQNPPGGKSVPQLLSFLVLRQKPAKQFRQILVRYLTYGTIRVIADSHRDHITFGEGALPIRVRPLLEFTPCHAERLGLVGNNYDTHDSLRCGDYVATDYLAAEMLDTAAPQSQTSSGFRQTQTETEFALEILGKFPRLCFTVEFVIR